MSEEQWLEGYYRPVIDEKFEDWVWEWSMGPHADPDWIWIPGGYYSEEKVRALVATGQCQKRGHR